MKSHGKEPANMQVVRTLANEYIQGTPIDRQSVHGLGTHIQLYKHIYRVTHEIVPDKPDAFANKIRDQIFTPGRNQQFNLFAAATSVIPPDVATSDVLRGSDNLSIIASMYDGNDKNDRRIEELESNLFVLACRFEPQYYLHYNPDTENVRFTEPALREIGNARRPGKGCPGLKQIVTLGNGTVTSTTAAAWSSNTEAFIRQHHL